MYTNAVDHRLYTNAVNDWSYTDAVNNRLRTIVLVIPGLTRNLRQFRERIKSCQRIPFRLLLLLHPFRRKLAHGTQLLDALLLPLLAFLFPLLRQGIEQHVVEPLLRFLDFLVGNVATRHRVHEERVGPRKERIDHMVLILTVIDNGRIARQQAPLGKRVRGRQILHVIAQIDALVGRVQHLGVAQQVYGAVHLMIIHLVGPGIVGGVEHEDMVSKIDQPRRAVVPAGISPEETIVAPQVGIAAEMRALRLVEISQLVGLDLDRVHVELHLVLEREESLLAVVGALAALDHVAVLVFHRAAVFEYRHAVLGVVGQALRAQGVAVLVEELHQRAAEQGPAFIDPVDHLLALEHGLVLDDLHVAEGFDVAAVHVPRRGVAQEIGVVVEETGMSLHQTVLCAVLLILLGPLGLEQAEDAVLRRGLAEKRRAAAQNEQQHRQQHPSSRLHALFNPAFPFKIAALEHRVDDDVGTLLFLDDEVLDGLHRILVVDLVDQGAVIVLVVGRMGRKDFFQV